MALALAVFIAANLLGILSGGDQLIVAGVSSGLLWLSYSWPVLLRPRPADLVTALRLALALAAFSLSSVISIFASLGLFILALALDGVDGWLARRTGPTAFGALFDQESDNAYLAALWLATFGFGRDMEHELLIGLGLVIPCYRILLVALRHFRLLGDSAAAEPRRLLGLPREKLLFVLVAVLSLKSYALAAAALPLPAAITTMAAVACSTLSFWPDFFPAKS